ncbi:MAG: hypothetical protein LC650_01070 [Actinobacteria bacterium]|nr:hypothetical protein [Actinomycetota bacterium]
MDTASWQCTYTKTLRGVCDQQKSLGAEYCFYHEKVMAKLVTDVDEESVIKNMPTIKG